MIESTLTALITALLLSVEVTDVATILLKFASTAGPPLLKALHHAVAARHVRRGLLGRHEVVASFQRKGFDYQDHYGVGTQRRGLDYV